MSKANELFQRIMISGGRACGRTHAAIEGLKGSPNATYVCASQQQAIELKTKYPWLNVIGRPDPAKLIGRHPEFFISDHHLLQILWAEREREHEDQIFKLMEALSPNQSSPGDSKE